MGGKFRLPTSDASGALTPNARGVSSALVATLTLVLAIISPHQRPLHVVIGCAGARRRRADRKHHARYVNSTDLCLPLQMRLHL